MIDRITILGGSSVYIPEFVLSVISRNLPVKEIVLLGRPGRKLDVVSKFCQRLVDRSGFPVSVTSATDLAEAVTGAKYVLNHVRVGGMKARMRDEMLPPDFDMFGDETLGAGGFAKALRTLPVVFEQARAIQKVNPEAYFINLTNPMGVVVEALVRYSKLKVVGVCDLPGAYKRKVAEVLERDASELNVDYLGLYHLGWIQDVRVDQRSCMGYLLEALEHHADDEFDKDLIQLFRMIPTRTAGYYFHRTQLMKKQKNGGRFRAQVLHEAEGQILRLYEDEHLCEIPELTRQRNAVWYDETIAPLICALEKAEEEELVVCLRNGDSIRDLPKDCSVEVPAAVSQNGIAARKVGSLPRFVRGLFIAFKESERLTIEAVRHKSYDCALQALAINPFVPCIDTAKRFLDRLIKEEKFELH